MQNVQEEKSQKNFANYHGITKFFKNTEQITKFRSYRTSWLRKTLKKESTFTTTKKDSDVLSDMIPSLLGSVETFKTTCNIIDECLVYKERTEIERKS